jgi:hypothetical protein
MTNLSCRINRVNSGHDHYPSKPGFPTMATEIAGDDPIDQSVQEPGQPAGFRSEIEQPHGWSEFQSPQEQADFFEELDHLFRRKNLLVERRSVPGLQ